MNTFLESLSIFLASETNGTSEDAEVLAYSLTILTNTVIGYLAIILVASLMGIFSYAMAAVITVALMRVFSGGAHASSSARCIGFGAVIFPVMGLLVKDIQNLASFNLPTVIYILTIAAGLTAGLIALKYAPADTPSKPISSKSQKKKLKIFSVGVVAVWALTVITGFRLSVISVGIVLSSALGLFWQAFTLTPIGYRCVNYVDAQVKQITNIMRRV